MAEYMNKDNVYAYLCNNMMWYDENGSMAEDEEKDNAILDLVNGIPTADVIERAEYEKVLEENKQLKHIISDKVDKDIKCAFEVKELHSKINKAIQEIDFLRQHRAKYITEDSKICIDSGEVLKILKNIGE